MESLILKFRGLLQRTDFPYQRFLTDKINWGVRCIGIAGARGVGKSTLMIQRIKASLPLDKTLYVSLDDLYFRQHSLTEVADEFYKMGGRHLFLDEVHKYDQWQQEVKNMYDFYPDLQIVLTGSSIISLQKSAADLSRRLVMYHLPGLSFREYLGLKHGITLPVVQLDHLLKEHEQIAQELLNTLESPLALYRHYFRYGVFPFFLEGEDVYYMRINQLINLIIDYDLPEAREVEGTTLAKMKKLLYFLSKSVPFTPNISKLTGLLETSRNHVLEMLDMLEKARLIRNLRSAAHGISIMHKPDKIYLHNTNFIHALAEGHPNPGNIRETLFLSHLQDAGYTVNYPGTGDFLIDGRFTFEIGGKGKSIKQVIDIPDSFVAADDLERGFRHKIPLWLFGMLN